MRTERTGLLDSTHGLQKSSNRVPYTTHSRWVTRLAKQVMQSLASKQHKGNAASWCVSWSHTERRLLVWKSAEHDI